MYLLVFIRVQVIKQAVLFLKLFVMKDIRIVFLCFSCLLQDGDTHGEMVILHCRSCIDSCQGRPYVNHELVVEPPVIKIMAYCTNP